MNLLKKLVMYFTLQEREKRLYEHYEINRKELENLSNRKLHAKYIKLKSEYEFKKVFFTFFIVTLFISILMGIWKNFYQFFQKTLKLFFYQENSIEVTKVSLFIYSGIFGIVVIVMFICIIIYLKNMYRIYEYILLIEEIREEKLKKNSEE